MSGWNLRLANLPAELQTAIRSVRPALVAVAGASGLINLLMMVGPVFMLQTYDRVLPSRSVSTLIGLLLIAMMLLVIQAAVDVLRSRVLMRVGEAFDEAIRRKVFDSVQQSAIAQPDADGLQIMRDADTVRSFMSGNGLVALCDLPWTPFYILICTLFHPLMGLAVATGAIALGLITAAAEVMTREPTRSLVGFASNRWQMAQTAFQHAEIVQAMGMTERMSALWSQRTQDFLRVQRKTSDLTAAFGSSSRFLRLVLQSSVLALGAWLVINQQATAGVMLAATILSIRALAPIELAIANWRGFIAARASFDRLRNALATMPATPDLTPLPTPKHELKVNSISVRAPRSDTLVLHEVSFGLKAGSAIAVVGPSGSGKSTLARTLLGVVSPVRGVIRIDGAALAQWNPVTLGGAIGYLPQDVALFRGTVAENISRFAAVRDADGVIAAAREADVHDLILRLPQGYETEVGDGGMMLSGGQRQRIALARALYGQPFMMILDEPNSNLDNMGEQALIKAITGVRQRGGIVVVIAHRPTLLAAVDQMLVLNEGRVQALGLTESVIPLLMQARQPAASESKPRKKPQAASHEQSEMSAAE